MDFEKLDQLNTFTKNYKINWLRNLKSNQHRLKTF